MAWNISKVAFWIDYDSIYDTISRNDINQFLQSFLVRSYKQLSKKCCHKMLQEKKTPATTLIKCEKKPFGNDLKGITEISLRIMNLYWQVTVFEPIDIYV